MKTNNPVEEPMAKNATVKLRIDEQKRDRIKKIAAHEDRSMSYVIESAIDDRIAYEEAFERGVEKAIIELDRDGGIPHDEVREWVVSLGTKNILPRPKPRKIV
jgi:predicted transcriptional regulator